MASFTITTEDGVKLKPGDRVYNYYDMKSGIITDNYVYAPDLWVDVRHDDGTRTTLNGTRLCSIEFAKRRGFPNAA